MSEGLGRPLRGFAIRWIALSALGLGVGLALGLGLAGPIEALVGMMLVTPVVLALARSLFGVSQWLAVGRWGRAAALWVAASALAFGVGMTLGIVLVETVGRAITGEQVRLLGVGPLGRVLSLAVIGTLTGSAVGVAQRLALRAHGRAPSSWVARCALAFGMGFPGGGLTADLLLGGLRSPAGFATFLGATGLIVGVLTMRAAAGLAEGRSLRAAS